MFVLVQLQVTGTDTNYGRGTKKGGTSVLEGVAYSMRCIVKTILYFNIKFTHVTCIHSTECI